ncbi:MULTISPECIES: DUF2785 domain-containing protein [Paenibacillus]|uniref:DUF2785 domain-containing protein n=1 Tax=Paenibacillus borealis TaxID=160799 RepID=A0ABX3H715_PAEBO|nr:DUF2785 domain-containing protein [Paenibacillus borealis]OMD46241.1 hypothetical protein BSK56_17085 [Paenibacillus borealis]
MKASILDDDFNEWGTEDTRTELIRKLQRLEEARYILREGERLQDFTCLMLRHIGDPEPVLREHIYSIFYIWLKRDNKFSCEEMRKLLAVLMDDRHLFYRIGSEGDQSVLTRAFSVLPVALIVQRDRNNPFLTPDEFQHLKHSLLRYYQEEKDLRGYLAVEGWAHAAAHGADALEELIRCRESDNVLQREVLEAVKGMLHNGVRIFDEEEDERMASIVDTMISEALLPQQEIADWIHCLSKCTEWPDTRTQRIARVNGKNFVRSLYFRTRVRNDGNNLILNGAMLTAEAKLNRFNEAN